MPENGQVAPYPMSEFGKRAINPIRQVLDTLKVPPNPPGKQTIPLSLGDPTHYGNFKTPTVFIDAVCNAVRDYKMHGYHHAAGMQEPREAVAYKYSYEGKQLIYSDVIIASGCSGALEIAIKALASSGDNILVPNPCFPLYRAQMQLYCIEPRSYSLSPEKNWEANLEEMDGLIDKNTRAILVNNPSNPCGSVYSKKHLLDILAVAKKHKIAILADEIYGNLVFNGKFHPLGKLSGSVPVLSVGGLAKEFLVPGFRVGWVICYNAGGMLDQVWAGALRLANIILGANTLVQAALKIVLCPAPGSLEDRLMNEYQLSLKDQLRGNAEFLYGLLQNIPGLQVIKPSGAMYIMVKIDVNSFDDAVTDDITFARHLASEEFVIVLPGTCFGLKNYVRLVFSPPHEKLQEASQRIADFCRRHKRKKCSINGGENINFHEL